MNNILPIQNSQYDFFDESLVGLIDPLIFTYAEVKSLREEAIWRNLKDVTVREAVEKWFKSMSKLTAINYRSAIKQLEHNHFINTSSNLQQFSQVNHNTVIDSIKKNPSINWSECTRQARAAAYISFTSYLCRQTDGIIRKAVPNTEVLNKTFQQVHKYVVTEAMNQKQWGSFLRELYIINQRDCLIAKVALQGGKRIGEVLSLHTTKIDWLKNQICFRQSKSRVTIDETIITYPLTVMKELENYINEREGLVFVTCNHRPVTLGQLAKTFEKAGEKAGIPFKVTPHVLRASAVTYLKLQGFSDSDIQKVTGHCSSAMVNAYDKSSRADNASNKVFLVM